MITSVGQRWSSFENNAAQTLQNAINPKFREEDCKTPRTVSATGLTPIDPHPSQPLDILVWVTRAIILYFLYVARTIATGGTGGLG